MEKLGLYVLFLILKIIPQVTLVLHITWLLRNNHLPIVPLVVDDQLNRYTAAVILISKHLSARGF